MKILPRRQFGDPVLRKKTKPLSSDQIKSTRVQQLIKDMRHTLVRKKLGIGMAAPQVGSNYSIAVISLRPTALRPKLEKFDLVIINPKIIKNSSKKIAKWEGCISGGSDGTADLFAKVPRYEQITIEYFDENANKQEKIFSGLKAQVIQHEVDNLNGLLFVDRVEDTKSFMTYSEYKKRIINSQNNGR